jgi:hypothetical protein
VIINQPIANHLTFVPNGDLVDVPEGAAPIEADLRRIGYLAS